MLLAVYSTPPSASLLSSRKRLDPSTPFPPPTPPPLIYSYADSAPPLIYGPPHPKFGFTESKSLYSQMDAESTQPNVRFSFFPLFFGVVRAPPLPPGTEGPAEPDRIVMLNPISQRMVIFQGGGVDVDSQDALDAVLREVMAMSLMEGGRRPPPASKASILEMKTVEAVGGEGECAVCLEEFGREGLREMPCGHRYHGDCICKWLEINGSCPICRHQMPEEEGVAKKVDEDGDGHVDEESRGGLSGQIWVRIGLGGQSQEDGERRESQEQERSRQNEERAVDD